MNEILRMHPIKPHWMFALDNLVRECAQVAVSVLAPELVENLAPSTVDSAKSSKSSASFDMHDKIMELRAQNNMLTQELIESQKQYEILVSMSDLKIFD